MTRALVWFAVFGLLPSFAHAQDPSSRPSSDPSVATVFHVLPGEYGYGHRTCEHRLADGRVRCAPGRLRSLQNLRGRIAGGSVLSTAGLGLFVLSAIYLYNTRHAESCHTFFCTPGSTFISFVPAALVSLGGAFHLGRGGKGLAERRDILRSLRLAPWADAIRPPLGSRRSTSSVGLLLGGSF